MTNKEFYKYVSKVARTVKDTSPPTSKELRDYERSLKGLQKYKYECRVIDEFVRTYKEKENGNNG